MSTETHNRAECPLLERVRSEFQWILGEELGFDPRTSPEAMQRVEERLANWIINGGGAWMAAVVNAKSGQP